jgi:endonuclease III
MNFVEPAITSPTHKEDADDISSNMEDDDAYSVEDAVQKLLLLRYGCIFPNVSNELAVSSHHFSDTTTNCILTMTASEVQAIFLSDGSTASAVLVNPRTGTNFHQKVNQEFKQFLTHHTQFLLKFVIECNSKKRNYHTLKDCARIIFKDWVVANPGTTYLLEYLKDTSLFHVLQTIPPQTRHKGVTIPGYGMSPNVRQKIYRFISQVRKSLCELTRRQCTISKFSFGKGVMAVEGKFQIRELTSNDMIAILNAEKKELFISWSRKMLYTQRTNPLEPTAFSFRFDQYYHHSVEYPVVDTPASPPLLQTTINFPRVPNPPVRKTMVRAAKSAGLLQKAVLLPVTVSLKRLSDWSKSLDSDKRASMLAEYLKLEAVYHRLTTVHEVYPPRHFWEDVFTARCKEDPCCWTCRECRRRFSQISIVLVSCQGTRDALCLPHFGAVFRHPRYKLFSVEEWSTISIPELTMVFSQVSKQAQCAIYVKLFLGDFAFKADLPQEISQVCCYLGFGKKSACLLLNAMDPHRSVGIPVDRHLSSAFRILGWADPAEKDETMISKMVELWLPAEHWSRCNIVCAGLRQVWQSKFKDQVIAAAQFLGPAHTHVLGRCCSNKNNASPATPTPTT